MSQKRMRTVLLLLLFAIVADELMSSSTSTTTRCHALPLVVVNANDNIVAAHERPLLREFGRGITNRIRHSEGGYNRHGMDGAYTSDEIIPCLDMRSAMMPLEDGGGGGGERENYGGSSSGGGVYPRSSRRDIRRAFVESSRDGGGSGRDEEHDDDEDDDDDDENRDPAHGRSSGSGCTIVRLVGSDASSIRGLMRYADRFFDMVDDEGFNSDVRNAGVFRIDEHIYAGFDDDVNGEGRMQFLDTRIMSSNDRNVDRTLLPLEVGELVGIESLTDAHRGMEILLEIGTQITSAVLGMDTLAADKLIDDGTYNMEQTPGQGGNGGRCESKKFVKDDVSNSYHRLIRYLKPDQSGGPAFRAHVDSSFLTLIPMPELPGLEVWCPSKHVSPETTNAPSRGGGEWVRPVTPLGDEVGKDGSYACAYVIVLAGEFLQLTSNGQVPVCIHRVIPPNAPTIRSKNDDDGENDKRPTYKPRVSAPMFLRPRRGEDAMLDVGKDLRYARSESSRIISSSSSTAAGDTRCDGALYFEEGLIDESDGMHLWSAHDIMKRK